MRALSAHTCATRVKSVVDFRRVTAVVHDGAGWARRKFSDRTRTVGAFRAGPAGHEGSDLEDRVYAITVCLGHPTQTTAAQGTTFSPIEFALGGAVVYVATSRHREPLMAGKVGKFSGRCVTWEGRTHDGTLRSRGKLSGHRKA